MVARGMSGLMAGNGPPEGEPHRLPIAIADLAAGMPATSSILPALMARARTTGEGQRIDRSLFEAELAFRVREATHVLTRGTRPEARARVRISGLAWAKLSAPWSSWMRWPPTSGRSRPRTPLGSLERSISVRTAGVARALGWIWSMAHFPPGFERCRRSERQP